MSTKEKVSQEIIEQKEFVTTADRLSQLLATGKRYDCTTNSAYVDQLKGWVVTTTLKIYEEDGSCNHYMSSSFREINVASEFSPLETADTVSFGRALGKAGFGVSHSMATAEEVASSKSMRAKVEDIISDKPARRGRKPKEVATIVSETGKVIADVKEQDITHATEVAINVATRNNDIEELKKIATDIGVYDAGDLFVPQLIDGTRKFEDYKVLWEKLKANGATRSIIKEFAEENGVSFLTAEEFCKRADSDLIISLNNKLINQKNEG